MIRRRAAVLLAVSASALVLLPGGVRPVEAAWSEAEYVGAPVQVAPSDCSATGLYTASAAGALLAGSVQGVAVGSTAATAPLTAGPRRDAVALSNPFTTAAAGTTPVVSGTSLPLVLTASGSWGQAASTSGTGASSASITGTTPLGSVDVSGLLGRAPAATSLLPGLTGVGLDIGAPVASISQDACAAGWGATGTLVRTSGLSALSLRLSAGAVTDGVARLRTDGTAAGTALAATAASASSPVAAAAGAALRTAVAQVLGVAPSAVSLTAQSATIAPAVAAIPDAATGRWTSGTASVDTAAGVLRLDLLPSGTSSSGPDLETVTSAAMTAGAAGAQNALRSAGAAVTTAVATARDSAPVTAASTVTVSVAGTAALTVTLSTAAARADTVALTGAVPQVGVTVLNAALLTVPGNLAALVTAALGSLPAVQSAVSTEYLAKAPAPAAVLAADADAAATALGAQLTPIPAAISAVAGQRATSAASSWTGSLPTGVDAISALRLRVRDGAGTRMDLFVGSAAVGPDRPAAQ